VRILIAEDDPDCRLLLEATLAQQGWEVVGARDGIEAWEALRAPDRPPLAVLDWMMPGLDGLEVCRRVRATADTAATYLIVLTAKSRTEDLVAALRAGADDYVTKPFEREELRARLQVGARTVALQRSLTERVQALEETSRRLEECTRELQEREARLRAIVETAKDGIVTVGLDGVIREFNPAAEAMFGRARADAIGRPLADLLAPAADRTWLERAAGLPRGPLESRARHADGREFPVEVSLAAIELRDATLLSAFFRDITERRRLEVELRHAQKLESVGRLAAGIAHEINTPIQFVGDNVRFLTDGFRDLRRVLGTYRTLRGGTAEPLARAALQAEREADVPYLEEEIPRALTQTLEGIERVATIVRSMRDFAHSDDAEAPADLNRALESALAVASRELRGVADVETDLGRLPPVVCHVGDLNQVFLNLLVNAAHAVAATGARGRIRIRTTAEGGTVLVTIADTGAGIPEEIRSRVFDPFFTTKGIGRGTGQGLAIARAIVVEKHGGSLTFESEVGRGTTFSVRLPVRGRARPSRITRGGTPAAAPAERRR
jgi:PAS domain S-box-containing protein